MFSKERTKEYFLNLKKEIYKTLVNIILSGERTNVFPLR